jgi:drug/metabolite transporter (DMT)-like permease
MLRTTTVTRQARIQKFAGASTVGRAAKDAKASVTGLGDIETPILALVFCAIWSSAFVATKIGLQSSPPLYLASIRFLVAGPLMLAISFGLRQVFPSGFRALALFTVLGVLNNSLYLGLTFISLQSVSAAMVSFIATLNPLITAVFAHAMLNERMNLKKILGLIIGAAGVVFVMHRRLSLGFDDLIGIALALAGVVSLVLGTILFKRFAAGTGILMASGLQVFAAGLALLPVAFSMETASGIRVDVGFLSATAYLTLVVSVVGTLIWFRLLTRGTASAVSSYHFLTPVLGLFFAWMVLDERIVWSDVLGAVPISIGILAVTRSSRAAI